MHIIPLFWLQESIWCKLFIIYVLHSLTVVLSNLRKPLGEYNLTVQSKSLITKSFIQLLNYCMTEEITNTREINVGKKS